jgi:hypothetical protein
LEEVSRLKKDIEERDSKIRSLTLEIESSRESSNKMFSLMNENSILNEKLTRSIHDCESFKDRIKLLENDNKSLVTALNERQKGMITDDLMKKVHELIVENQRITDALLTMRKENDDLKEKLSKTDSKRVPDSSVELLKLNECIESLLKENEDLAKRFVQQSQTIEPLSKRIKILSDENFDLK